MKTESDILSSINRQSGMTVPDGYFNSFLAQMEDKLPERVPVIAVPPRTFWQKVRPYTYLAAMFAGIWCMLQMFNIMGSHASSSLDSNPVLAEAINNDTFINEYVLNDIDVYDIYDELYNQGVSVSELTSAL